MPITFESYQNIGVVRVDNPPVNAINATVRQALIEAIDWLNDERDLKIGLIVCAGRTFMPGADIAEFGKPMSGPTLPETLSAIEGSRKPVIAAIHGTALGGGLETALACHYRIALGSAQVGLPEVKLGLIPGAGGTQRLPRLIGVEPALQLILSGAPIGAKEAATLGMIDRVVEANLEEAALDYARELVSRGAPPRKVSDLDVDVTRLEAGFFAATRRRLGVSMRDRQAPQRIVDALEAAATLPFEQGLLLERSLFLSCQASPQSQALRHVFFAERRVRDVPHAVGSRETRAVRSIAVVGAGTMGTGIAMSFLNSGFAVTLLELSGEALERGLGLIGKTYRSSVAKGRLTAEEVEERMGRLTPTLSYDELADADLVIEAVFESLGVKKEVFSRLDQLVKPHAILASNTSYLSIDDIASSTSRPGDVVGMHFFSPANIMRLMEIVRGERTAPDVVATVIEVAKRLGKIGVVCANRDGFIGNRMLQAYLHQALLMVVEGAWPEQVDQALREFGMPMGVFQMSDLAGLDIGYRSRQERDPSTVDGRAYRTADRLVELGRLGQKTLAGYYDYLAGDRIPKSSTIVHDVIESISRELGITRRSFTTEEILERCLLALVNTGCEVLREGVASRASDIDVVYIHGYGFPAHRGGPLFWVEHAMGLPSALEKLNGYARAQDSRFFTVSPLLKRLVEEGRQMSDATEGST